jgi:hypothetical protein
MQLRLICSAGGPSSGERVRNVGVSSAELGKLRRFFVGKSVNSAGCMWCTSEQVALMLRVE